MKKIFTLFIAAVSALSCYANLDGNGYYRVKNYKTDRYASIIDNRGKINFVSTTADLQAIRLWRVFDDVSHDAASIFYITQVGSEYQLTAQGTGLYQIIGYYLKLRENGTADGQQLYMAYGTNGNATRYLADGNRLDRDFGSMTINGTGDFRKWYVLPVDAAGDDYFGAFPDVDSKEGLYTTLYADFPFSAYSKGVKMYYVSAVTSSSVTLTEIEGTVPKATPVVVGCVGKTASDNRLNVGGTASEINGNKLVGQYFNCSISGHINRVAYNPATMRVLGRCSDGSLGFVKASDLDFIPANTAYITVPESYPAEIKCVFGNSAVSEIGVDTSSGPKTVYTMTGVKLYEDATDAQISSLPKGIYIIGGKKVKI